MNACITPQSKGKLASTAMDAPWAAALSRLLSERGLNAVDLIGHGGVTRGPTISAILNPRTMPKVATLQQIANALEMADRFKNGQKSRGHVPLWEFFVSSDQAELLRKDAAHKAHLAAPPLSEEDRRLLDLGRRLDALMKADVPVTPPNQTPHFGHRRKKTS